MDTASKKMLKQVLGHFKLINQRGDFASTSTKQVEIDRSIVIDQRFTVGAIVAEFIIGHIAAAHQAQNSVLLPQEFSLSLI